MVGKIIKDYMEAGNKKLTVPGFGTFMRKESGEVIFVDLLRKDDGKLRELVEDYGHYAEVEAMALVDRFVFETKNSIEKSGSSSIEGFGTMFLDDKGLYQFGYAPAPQPKTVADNSVQERLFPKEEPRTEQKTAEKPARRPAAQPLQKQAARPGQRRISESPEPNRIRKKPAPRRNSRRSKPDTLIIVAIVVAVIAILILIFGLSAGNMPFLK